jgi:TonB family protein
MIARWVKFAFVVVFCGLVVGQEPKADKPKDGADASSRKGFAILSDTQGVDFGPYLNDALTTIKRNWFDTIPDIARNKRGKLAIEFAILKEGNVRGMKLTESSGNVILDRAAWAGITRSSPFPPLPREFKGNYLKLRFHFSYNPPGEPATEKSAESSSQ